MIEIAPWNFVYVHYIGQHAVEFFHILEEILSWIIARDFFQTIFPFLKEDTMLDLYTISAYQSLLCISFIYVYWIFPYLPWCHPECRQDRKITRLGLLYSLDHSPEVPPSYRLIDFPRYHNRIDETWPTGIPECNALAYQTNHRPESD